MNKFFLPFLLSMFLYGMCTEQFAGAFIAYVSAGVMVYGTRRFAAQDAARAANTEPIKVSHPVACACTLCEPVSEFQD